MSKSCFCQSGEKNMGGGGIRAIEPDKRCWETMNIVLYLLICVSYEKSTEIKMNESVLS